MSKIRVHELAKELGLSSKECIEKLHDLGLDVKNHMSSIEGSDYELVNELLRSAEAVADSKKEVSMEEEIIDDQTTNDYEEIETEDYVDDLDELEELEALSRLQSKGGNKKKHKNPKAKFKHGVDNNPYKPQDVTYENDVVIPATLTVGEFAKLMKKGLNEIIMKLMGLGMMATINQELDFETAELIAADYGIAVSKEYTEEEMEDKRFNFEDDPNELVKRAPVVTVMGHVDHGKTSLLDAIRNTSVTTGEAGGITQHIGASEVRHNGEKIVFLDTPGHEAFTSLRARGAKVTDISILVVAADDGVMPQTKEAIDHAKAAGVPIIVAINKIDKINANQDRVKQELADNGLLIEEWGGEIICVPVSALKGEGIDTLLEMVLLVAEMLELKANPSRPGIGTILEAKVDKGRGTVATALLETGMLQVGDPVIAGTTYGRVRAMFNHLGKKVKIAGPATCVEITGLNDVPQAGDKFYVAVDERQARILAERRQLELRSQSLRKNPHVSLEDLFNQIKDGQIKDLNIIVKADVHGSIEALKGSLLKLTNDEVRVNVIHSNVGTISENDILLASASNAIIIGFNVRPSTTVQDLAAREGVDLKTYRIIYEAIDDVASAMKGMLDPEFKEVVIGRIQVRETFKVPNLGFIAGAYVLTGKVVRNAQIRLIREGIVIHEGKISSLRRFKDDAKEVAAGYECGIGFENYNDLKIDDEIEAFIIEEIKRN